MDFRRYWRIFEDVDDANDDDSDAVDDDDDDNDVASADDDEDDDVDSDEIDDNLDYEGAIYESEAVPQRMIVMTKRWGAFRRRRRTTELSVW